MTAKEATDIASSLEKLQASFASSLSSIKQAVSSFAAQNPELANKFDMSAIQKAQHAVVEKAELFKNLLHDAPEEAGKQANSYLDSLKGLVEVGVKTVSEKTGEWSKLLEVSPDEVKEGQEMVAKLGKAVEELKKSAAGWLASFQSAMAAYVKRKQEKGFDASEPAEDF